MESAQEAGGSYQDKVNRIKEHREKFKAALSSDGNKMRTVSHSAVVLKTQSDKVKKSAENTPIAKAANHGTQAIVAVADKMAELELENMKLKVALASLYGKVTQLRAHDAAACVAMNLPLPPTILPLATIGVKELESPELYTAAISHAAETLSNLMGAFSVVQDSQTKAYSAVKLIQEVMNSGGVSDQDISETARQSCDMESIKAMDHLVSGFIADRDTANLRITD